MNKRERKSYYRAARRMTSDPQRYRTIIGIDYAKESDRSEKIIVDYGNWKTAIKVTM